MATSRKVARDALVTLLKAALVGEGLPAKNVEGSKQASLEGITPLVEVLGRSSDRKPLTTAGAYVVFGYVIRVWVLQSLGDWTPADAEDALDAIEAIIAGICTESDRTSKWEFVEYAGPTAIVEVAIDGIPYLLESISIKVQLRGN